LVIFHNGARIGSGTIRTTSPVRGIGKRSCSLRVFVSYRREDSADTTDRLVDALNQQFGAENVFLDVDSIGVGTDFIRVASDWITRSDAMLVVIGKRWLAVSDDQGNLRLQNPADYVRLEIEAALAGGTPIIPVIVQGASVPAPEISQQVWPRSCVSTPWS
jgi:hypothetical protein